MAVRTMAGSPGAILEEYLPTAVAVGATATFALNVLVTIGARGWRPR
jgi:hypothetical protein